MPKIIKKKIHKKSVDVNDIEEIQSMFSKVFEERRKAVLYAVGVIALIGILGGGLTIYKTNRAEKALLIESQAIEAFNAAASASGEEGKEGGNGYIKALEFSQEAADVSCSPTSMFYIAESQLKLGEKDKAIEAYQKFLKYYGNSTLAPAVHARMAAIRMDNEDYTGALADTESIKDDVVWSDTALIEKANIYDRMGKPDEAKSSLSELTSSYPDSPWVMEAKNRIGEENGTAESASEAAPNPIEPESKPAEPEPTSN